MKLTNSDLTNFVGRCKLTAEKKADYTAQIENLAGILRRGVEEHTSLKITRVLRAGSWKKGTALRPIEGKALDIDLVFSLAVEEASARDLQTLQKTMLEFLVAAYPNKSREDFEGGEKTVGLVFRGSGLEVDLVPVVPLAGKAGYVYQPTKMPPFDQFVTSVDGQLDFIHAIKAQDSGFTNIVRMLKQWRNRQELHLPSFAVELLVANLNRTRGPEDSLETAVIRFFDFLLTDPFPTITFPDAIGEVDAFDGSAVCITDPTNRANNVMQRVGALEWAEIVSKAEEASDHLYAAQAAAVRSRTVDGWREIFGHVFNIEQED